MTNAPTKTQNTKTCQYPQCNKPLTRDHPKANNKKYCTTTCRSKHSYQKNKEKHIKNNDKQTDDKHKDNPDAIPCRLCGRKFVAPLRHAWQKHGISAKEYKQQFQLYTTKGILTKPQRERHQQVVKDNPHIIVNNLINKGKQTRTPNQPNIDPNYQRTPQHIKRLQQHIKTIIPEKGSQEAKNRAQKAHQTKREAKYNTQ